MRVIHGTWARGALCLWAEDPGPRRQPPQPAARRQPPGPAAPRPHPFACEAAALADLLSGLPGPAGEAAGKAVRDELTLSLPSAPGTAGGPRPLASPGLAGPDAGEPAPRRGRVVLADWRVPVLAVEPAGAIEVLGAAAELAGVDAAAGASLPYLAALARFACGLAARGRVLPVLAREDGGYAARWRPVLVGADAQRARDLAAAMPPCCRAARQAPGPVLSAVLDALADAAARARLPASLLPARRGRPPARVPVAERYVAALATADARLEVASARDEAEAAELAAGLGAWLDAARMAGYGSGPVRTCFRLVEPDQPDAAAPGGPDASGGLPASLASGGLPASLASGGLPASLASGGPPAAASGGLPARPASGGGAWRVEFALQSVADPSLVVSAADVWAGRAPPLAGRDPADELLAGLGAAARLFGELEQALREPAPACVRLEAAAAFRFLKQTGPLLSGAGFGVLLPDWVRKARLGLKLTARSRSSPGASAAAPRFGLDDLVDFRYDVAVGDRVLDPDELAELARLKVPLVRLRGQWVELDAAHLKAALRFLERTRAGTMTAADALAASVRGPDEKVPLVAVEADGWLGDLLSGQAERRLRPVPAPQGFAGTLRPYQERGLAWLSFLGDLGLGGILADDMGLGKTIQLLSLLCRPGSAGPTLLVCPMSLVGNWQREAARFTPQLRVHVHHGADRLDGDSLAAALAQADLVITSYGVATRDRAALSGLTWARVVCDEAQNIKNHATKQARAVRSLPARTRIALTGTPVENRLSELWSIMEFTNPGLLGPAERFRETYAVPIERHGSADAAAALRRRTRPFVLRRLKTDKAIISDLPDKQEIKVWCNLTAEQASLYQATVTDMLSRIAGAPDDISRRGLVLATMAKLKQVCNHPAHLLGDGSRLPGRSGKLARLEEICDEIVAGGDKALCFTQYAEFGRMLRPHLEARLGCPVLFLHGGTPKRQRDAMVEEFGSLEEPALFLLSLKAGGTGLNLTAASHVIHVDRWWNPAVEDQATDRAFRIGQRRNVQVRKFICVGTVEERIDAMIEEKKSLAEQVVGGGEGWLTGLSTDELRAVLTLSPDAVSE